MPAFESVFAALTALAPGDRIEICGLLRDPRGPVPLRPEEIGRLPVPTDPIRRASVLAVLDGAVRRALDANLAGWTFGQIVPDIQRLAGGVDTAASATNRLVAVLQPHGAPRWASLAPRRIEEVRSWRGMGTTLTAEVVRLAVAAAVREHVDGGDRGQQGTLFRPARASETARPFDEALLAITDHRARAAFEHLELQLDRASALTAPMVADLLGLGYERVRQLRILAREQVVQAVGRLAEIDPVVRALAERLGEAAPRDEVDPVLRALGLGGTRDPAGMLAAWLSGPYREVTGHPGWLARDPAELVRHTAALLGDGGGVHDRRSVLADLARFGVTPAWAEAWLLEQPVRSAHDLVVHVTARPGRMAERALDAAGRAMSVAELRTWMTDPAAAAALPAELRRSARFVETAPDQWELADWGGEPSAHVVRVEVPVTERVLAGDDGELPAHLAAALGLPPGRTRRFPTRFGPFAVVYDGDRIVRSSVRPVALASGAGPGAVLVFVVDPRSGSVEVEVLNPTPSGRTRAHPIPSHRRQQLRPIGATS